MPLTGNQPGCLAVHSDISESRLANIALKDSEDRFRSIYEYSSDAIMLLNEHGFFDCNEATLKIFGCPDKATFCRLHPADLSPLCQEDGQNSMEKANTLIMQAMSEGSAHFEWQHKRVDSQEVFDAEVLLTSLVGEDGPYLEASVRDISERKRAEKALVEARKHAEESAKAKSSFLSNMSHEIRTPMNAIIGFGELLAQSGLDQQQSGYVRKINRAARALLHIINDVLDFSKIEAGKMRIESVDFVLSDIIGYVCDLVAHTAANKGIEVIVSSSLDLTEPVCGDPLRLQQILLNLVNNAVKFTHQGEVVISASGMDTDDGARLLRFSVRDTGIGMHEDQLQHLFSPFTQADGSTTRKYGGTGLGLSICKRLVELMGGRIHATSVPGEGSCFEFTLRCQPGSKTKGVSMQPSPEKIKHTRVLVVDDNPTARESISAFLRHWDVPVHAVSSGKDALSSLQDAAALDCPYQVVLMDWSMPGMDGVETAKRIRTMAELSPKPRVILLSGYSKDELPQNAEQYVEDFIAKPVMPSTLFEHIFDDATLAAEAASPAAAVDSASLQGLRVLLVEDNAVNQELARIVLNKFGVKVSVAMHGQQALDILGQDAEFDCILMDMQMPVLNGVDATRLIRQRQELQHIPVIAMTANAMKEAVDECLAAGMNDHISKPVRQQQLFDVLHRWVQPSRSTIDDAKQHVTAAADMAALKQLHGVDVIRGIDQVGGDAAVFRKVLLHFAENQAHIAADIRQALVTEDYEQAARLAHTLKGLGGTIAAKEVQRAAKLLEKAIRRQDEEAAGELLVGLEKCLQPLLKAIRQLDHVDHTAVNKDGETLKQAFATASCLLTDLLALLQDDDSEAVSMAEQLLEALKHTPLESAARQLLHTVEGFDYEEAIAALDIIQQQLVSQSTGASYDC